MVELLKTLPEDTRSRLVAAYVLGYKVTPDDVAQAPWIVAAQDSTDTGVTICYNSVSDVKYVKPIVCESNIMCINPVNWRTDATPAQLHDTITVTLSPEYKVLVLDGYDGSSLPNILDILNVGDYHGVEPWMYSECLRRNFKQRIEAFRAVSERPARQVAAQTASPASGYRHLYHSVEPVLKNTVSLFYIVERITMRDERRSVYASGGYEVEYLGTVATIDSTGLEGKILAVHLGQRQYLRLVIQGNNRNHGIGPGTLPGQSE